MLHLTMHFDYEDEDDDDFSRAGLRARRIRIIAHSGIWSAQRPTLLDFLHEIDIDFHKISYVVSEKNSIINYRTSNIQN